MDPLDELTFDCSTFALLGDTADARRWTTPEGDAFALHHFPFPPALRGSPASIDVLRTYCRTLAEPGSGLVEVETRTVGTVIAVRTILKAAQQPNGRTYVGTLTVPFRDFSYVLEVRCEERGSTGLREAAILDRLLKTHEVEIDDATGELRGWGDDPYDYWCRAPLVRNRSERADFDTEFIDHPLTRARRTLGIVESTLRISPRVRHAPRLHAYTLAALVH